MNLILQHDRLLSVSHGEWEHDQLLESCNYGQFGYITIVRSATCGQKVSNLRRLSARTDEKDNGNSRSTDLTEKTSGHTSYLDGRDDRRNDLLRWGADSVESGNPSEWTRLALFNLTNTYTIRCIMRTAEPELWCANLKCWMFVMAVAICMTICKFDYVSCM